MPERELLAEPCNAGDYERLARERLPEGAYGYFAGGADDECALADNVDGWRRWVLRPRVLVDVERDDRRHHGARHAGVDAGAGRAGGDPAHGPRGRRGRRWRARRPPPERSWSSPRSPRRASADIAAAAPDSPRWFQVYRFRDSGVTQALVDQATDAGYQALVLTVDAPRLGRRERDLRTGFAVPAEVTVPSFAAATGGAGGGGTPADLFALMDASVTWRDLEELASSTDLPVLVKGVMTAEDAQLACEHGAAGVVVSNHGGRQLDCTGPTAGRAAGGRRGGRGPRRGARRRRHPPRRRRGAGAGARRRRRSRRPGAAVGTGGARRAGRP